MSRNYKFHNPDGVYFVSFAVVEWIEVFKATRGDSCGSGDNGLDWADKDMLSSYNAEMNSVISAFKDWKTDADPDAYYLFVVPQFSEGGVEGFMPRNRRFGFVTLSQLDARLVAHEIGHGAFNLRHTFPEVAQGSTDNLMDYSEGNSLLKPQWDLIHNPETTTGLFDDMEDGAMISRILGFTIAGDNIFIDKFYKEALLPLITESLIGRQLLENIITLCKSQNKPILIYKSHESITKGMMKEGFYYSLGLELETTTYDAANGRGDVLIEKTPATTFAHELRHLYQRLTKMYDLTLYVSEEINKSDILENEIDAIYFENQVRAQLGLSLRTHYRGNNVFAMKRSKTVLRTSESGYIYKLEKDPNITSNESDFIRKHLYLNIKLKETTKSKWIKLHIKTQRKQPINFIDKDKYYRENDLLIF